MARRPEVWKAALERLRTLLRADREAPTRYRLAALMMGLAPKAAEASKIARAVMTGMRFDRPIVSDVAYLVKFAMVGDETLGNWRQVRAMQNLAATPRRVEFLCGFMAALGRTEEASRLRAESARLVAEGRSGFEKGKEGERKEVREKIKEERGESGDKKPRRRRHRGGRRRRRRRG